MRSLRRTLAVRFAATMAVGLVATSAAIWWAASRVLRHQVDQSVAALAFVAANELTQSSQCTAAGHVMALNAMRYRREINRYIVFRDAHCQAVRAIPGWAVDLPVDSAALTAANADRPTFSVSRWHDKTVRSAYLKSPGDTGSHGLVIQVAASLEPVQGLERTMLFVLIGLVMLGTSATFTGAWRLSGSAVRPVTEITEQATRIEASTLDQEISAHAATREYSGLVAVLNRMLGRLRDAFAAQRRFTGDVSHELRTPLTALRGEIEVALRADRTPRDYQIVLHSALEEIDRMTVMTEELLLITRADAGLIAPQREPTDLNQVVNESLHRLRHRITDKELCVNHTPTLPGPVPLDRGLITRLVDELLDNAVNYSDSYGGIEIRDAALPDGVRLTVEDRGPGIDPADLPHLFAPYYRADHARTRGSGTGLGLTTAQSIARLHGGSIRVENREDGGARVEVDLMVPNTDLHGDNHA